MARTLEQERAALEEEVRKLDERRRRLEEKEREQAIQIADRAGLFKLEPKRLTQLLARIKSLGVDEAEKRLGAG